MKRIICMLVIFFSMTANAQLEDYIILGGELSNSAATSVDDIDEVLPRMKTLGLNTVLVPIYWELMEPTEGQMDFTLVDRTINVARQQGLKIVPLWFGAWKNSMSCYAPAWFKRDVKRFPRAVTAEGKPLEIASCFSDNVLQADLKAFSALMHHIADKDPQREVVISVDEVTIDEQGNMHYLRRHNGDQSHQGRHARISVGDWKILHIQLYEFKE